MKKNILLVFLILFLHGCWYMGDPPSVIDECSQYGCGEGGNCKNSSNNGSICECYENYWFYRDKEKSVNYCISLSKQLLLISSYNHKFLLSNYGYDIPREIDSDNKFLYYSDSIRVYDGFYLLEDYHTIKLLDYNYELRLGGEIYFDKKIKEITHNDDDNIYKNIILFEDNTIEVYDRIFSIKLLEFSSGEEIKKISSNSYINQNNEFIYYNIINNELKTEYIQELSPALDIENYDDKFCSLMKNNKIKCMKKLENNENTINEPFIIENDENILFFKENCIYTDKNKLHCMVYGENKFKKEVFINTINKDHFGSTDTEFCYLNNRLYTCIEYEDMDMEE